MKTGVRVGSVVIVEDIGLLKDELSVRTWVGIVRRWTKRDGIRSPTRVNMVVVQGMIVFRKSRVLHIYTPNSTIMFWDVPIQFGG